MTQLFKDRILLLEEDLDDKLTDNLQAPKRPAVVFLKNLHTYEMEEYDGAMERTSLSLWLQDRGSRKMATPEKTVTRLTKGKPDCSRSDNNYCVVGFFKDQRERVELERLFQPGLSRYKDEPVNFYLIDTAAIRPDCKPETQTAIYRTKRNRLALAEPAGLFDKLDALLGGMPLPEPMPRPLADCFI